MKNEEKVKEKLLIDSADEKKSEASAGEKKPEKTLAEKKAEFAELIGGEYKEVFEEILKEKNAPEIRENSILRERLKQAEGILKMLSDRHSADYGENVKKASRPDFPDEGTEKYGMNPSNRYYTKNFQRENYPVLPGSSNAQAGFMEKLKSLYTDSAAVSKQYPEFNLAEEIGNPEFIKLIKNGVDMKTAYEVIHHDDILELIKKENALQAKKDAAMELEARNMRPVENGLTSGSSALLKKDVSKLSPEERAEIARRVAKGEIISF